MKISEIRKMTQNFPNFSSHAEQRQIHQFIRELGIDPSNLYQELEMESRFVDTHQDTTYSHSTVHLHSHTFYELIHCRNANGVEYLVGSDRYKLQRGDVIFISPGVSHCPIFPPSMPDPYIRDVLWISEEFIRKISDNFPMPPSEDFSKATLLRTAGTRWEHLGNLFHQGVVEAQNQEIGWEAAVAANTLTILTHLLRASQDIYTKSPEAEKPELLDQVLAYVETHLSEKITMADVARHFFISESTITQTFRKKMGVSFYRCVTQRRLISAKALIERGITLESVAEQVGFSDYSSFFRAFKQEYGISPRQYRKMYSTSNDSR